MSSTSISYFLFPISYFLTKILILNILFTTLFYLIFLNIGLWSPIRMTIKVRLVGAEDVLTSYNLGRKSVLIIVNHTSNYLFSFIPCLMSLSNIVIIVPKPRLSIIYCKANTHPNAPSTFLVSKPQILFIGLHTHNIQISKDPSIYITNKFFTYIIGTIYFN